MVKVIVSLSLLFFSSVIFAIDIEVGELYRLTGGSLETTAGTTIRQGTAIKVTGTRAGWSYGVQLLDSNNQPQGETYYVSMDWLRASASLLPQSERQDPIEAAVRLAIAGSQVPAQATEPPCECDHDAIAAAIELSLREDSGAVTRSLRPQRRPANLGTPASTPTPQTARPANVRSSIFESFVFKDQQEADQYFACYQKSDSLRNDYEQRYRSAIREMAQTFNQRTAGLYYQGDVDTLMSCLIFRESAHWRGGNSSTGARGLGQFTSDGRAEVREVLEYRPERVRDHDDRIRERQGERDAGRISEAQLQRDIRSIEAERLRHYRLTELKRLWESMPMENRPQASEITGDFTGNNDNYQAIFAMSSLLIRNCQIRLENEGVVMEPRTSLLACAGAYNIGVGGFMQNAIVRNGPQTLEGWLSNLRNSSDPQADQTHNHLVSIQRCISDGENFPPCGTGSDYCQALPMANACQSNADPMCLGECR